MSKLHSQRTLFKRFVGAALIPHGFEFGPGATAFSRCPRPAVIQSVELVTSRSHSGEKVLTLMLDTSIEHFRGSPGYFGPGLDWALTMDVLVANPQIQCELRLSPKGDQSVQVESWLQSVCRELEHVGIHFFDETSELDKILQFTESEFYRQRFSTESEVFLRLKRAMLLKLLHRMSEYEEELTAAELACHPRSKKDLKAFIAFLREYEVDAGE